MLSIEAKKEKKRKFKALPFILLILGLFSLIGAVAVYQTELNELIYGNSPVTTGKSGIYVRAKIPSDLKIQSFLEKYTDFELKSFREADIALTTSDGVLVKDSSYDMSEILFRKFFVPITKFGSLKRNISVEESENIGYFEEGLREYIRVNTDTRLIPQMEGQVGGQAGTDTEAKEMSCEEIKKFVNETGEMALVSVECIDKSVATLGVGGISILGRVGDEYRLTQDENYLDEYPLTYEIWLNYKKNSFEDELNFIRGFFDEIELSESKVHQIVMTGVTAMGRTVMSKIQEKGPEYPVANVKNVLSDADIAHTSNEVSFLEGCTQENGTLSFCTIPESLIALTTAGIDIVELTGNHNNDKGATANLYSMNLYDDAGITYVGGGKNIEDAESIRYLEIGDYTVAFIGYNYAGPSGTLATDERAGSAYYTEKLITGKLEEAGEKADTVVVVIQWGNENDPNPNYIQEASAKQAIQNGADIVVGSQGHGTQKMEFFEDGVIYYALGNFLFDQMFSDRVREGIILRLNTISGQIVNIEMLPYVIEDFSQPNFVENTIGAKIVNNVIN